MMLSNPIMLLFSENAMDFDPQMLQQALFWLGVIVIALILEALTTDLVSVWFAPGALVAMVLAVFGVHFVIQVVICLVISIALMILAKTVFKNFLHKRKDVVNTSVSALEGRTALVEEEINNQADAGVVKINGQLWRARMEDDTQIAPKGAHVQILHVNGTQLICKLIP